MPGETLTHGAECGIPPQKGVVILTECTFWLQINFLRYEWEKFNIPGETLTHGLECGIPPQSGVITLTYSATLGLQLHFLRYEW